MFWMRNKENSFPIRTLIGSPEQPLYDMQFRLHCLSAPHVHTSKASLSKLGQGPGAINGYFCANYLRKFCQLLRIFPVHFLFKHVEE